jgi:hypothetical protein
MPLISPEQAHFLAGPNDVIVATQDGALEPTCTHAFGLRCAAAPDTVSVFLPGGVAARAVSDLRVEPRISIACHRAETHRALQLKGRAVRVREVPPEERAAVEACWAAFVEECVRIGLPRRIIGAVVIWPAVQVDVEVTELFDQTPGPGAGQPCGGAS